MTTAESKRSEDVAGLSSISKSADGGVQEMDDPHEQPSRTKSVMREKHRGSQSLVEEVDGDQSRYTTDDCFPVHETQSQGPAVYPATLDLSLDCVTRSDRGKSTGGCSSISKST